MHELHYHKHAYLYPLARSFFLQERSTWVFFKELIALVTLWKKQLSADSQDCSHRLNFVCSTVKGTLYFLFHSVAMCAQQSVQLWKGKLLSHWKLLVAWQVLFFLLFFSTNTITMSAHSSINNIYMQWFCIFFFRFTWNGSVQWQRSVWPSCSAV